MYKIAIVLLTSREAGVKALEECPTKNESFFDVLPHLGRKQPDNWSVSFEFLKQFEMKSFSAIQSDAIRWKQFFFCILASDSFNRDEGLLEDQLYREHIFLDLYYEDIKF